MRKYAGLVLLCGLVLVHCGAPEEAPKVEAPETTTTDVYYLPLAEADLQRMIKAMPVFKAAVEKLELAYSGGQLEAVQNLNQALDKQVPELDAKLRAAGMAWNEFWPAYTKTALAIGAVMIDSVAAAMKEQMKGQPPAVVEQALSSLEASRTIYNNVPQANRDLVKKYMAELKSVFEME